MSDEESIDALEKLEGRVDAYEKSIGLVIPAPENLSLLESHLALTGEMLRKLSWADLVDICADVAAIQTYLQKELNRISFKVGWLESRINLFAAKRQENYHGYTYQERRAVAIANEPDLYKLESNRMKYQALLDSNAFIIKRIDNWLNLVDNLKYTKRKELE